MIIWINARRQSWFQMEKQTLWYHSWIIATPSTWAEIPDLFVIEFSSQNWRNDCLDQLDLHRNPRSMLILTFIFYLSFTFDAVTVTVSCVIKQLKTEPRTWNFPLEREAGVLSGPAGGHVFILQPGATPASSLQHSCWETLTFSPRKRVSVHMYSVLFL